MTEQVLIVLKHFRYFAPHLTDLDLWHKRVMLLQSCLSQAASRVSVPTLKLSTVKHIFHFEICPANPQMKKKGSAFLKKNWWWFEKLGRLDLNMWFSQEIWALDKALPLSKDLNDFFCLLGNTVKQFFNCLCKVVQRSQQMKIYCMPITITFLFKTSKCAVRKLACETKLAEKWSEEIDSQISI